MTVTDHLKFSPYAPVRYQKESWWMFAVEAARAGWVLKDGRVADRLMDKTAISRSWLRGRSTRPHLCCRQR